MGYLPTDETVKVVKNQLGILELNSPGMFRRYMDKMVDDAREESPDFADYIDNLAASLGPDVQKRVRDGIYIALEMIKRQTQKKAKKDNGE